MTLVDTNVLLDVLQDDPRWAPWSQEHLETASLEGPLAINDVIYAELSISFERIEELEAVLKEATLSIEPMPRESLFLAGKAFRDYRRRRGTRNSVLPDFLIGAQAAINGWPILTRDPRRYRTYYPGVRLITPESGTG